MGPLPDPAVGVAADVLAVLDDGLFFFSILVLQSIKILGYKTIGQTRKIH